MVWDCFFLLCLRVVIMFCLDPPAEVPGRSSSRYRLNISTSSEDDVSRPRDCPFFSSNTDSFNVFCWHTAIKQQHQLSACLASPTLCLAFGFHSYLTELDEAVGDRVGDLLERGDRDEAERGDFLGVPTEARGESNEIISARLIGPELARTLLIHYPVILRAKV